MNCKKNLIQKPNFPLESTIDVEEYFKSYSPSIMGKSDLVSQVKIFLDIIENTSGTVKQSFITKKMFQLLSLNIWYINLHPNFHNTIITKLKEFEKHNDPGVHQIAEEFDWIKTPNCAYCGAPFVNGPPQVLDEGTYFCSKIHQIDYENNGDCAVFPVPHKLLLDFDLDYYMKNHPGKDNTAEESEDYYDKIGKKVDCIEDDIDDVCLEEDGEEDIDDDSDVNSDDDSDTEFCTNEENVTEERTNCTLM